VTDRPCVLLPFDIAEALTIPDAAALAGRTAVTLRNWASIHDLGRIVGGRWMISRVALAMYMDDDPRALKAYLSGDRESEQVLSYFRRFGLSTQKNIAKNANKENNANPAI
jgi:hypothetical protein